MNVEPIYRLPLVVGGLAAGTCTHGGAPHGGHGGERLIRRQASMEHNHKRGPNEGWPGAAERREAS